MHTTGNGPARRAKDTATTATRATEPAETETPTAVPPATATLPDTAGNGKSAAVTDTGMSASGETTATGVHERHGASYGTGGATSGSGTDAAATWVLVAEPRAAACARALTGRTLREWRVTDPGDIGDIVLMVDELVTNAVVHGTGPVRFALHLDGRRLLAEVGDGNPSAPARPAEPHVLDWAEAGRGLLLVAALAAEHGARPETEGKTVWFTRQLNPLDCHHPDPR